MVSVWFCVSVAIGAFSLGLWLGSRHLLDKKSLVAIADTELIHKVIATQADHRRVLLFEDAHDSLAEFAQDWRVAQKPGEHIAVAANLIRLAQMAECSKDVRDDAAEVIGKAVCTDITRG